MLERRAERTTPYHGVVFLAYVYPPDNYPGAARPYRLAKYLGRLGYPVRVVAASPSRNVIVDGNVYRVRGELDHHIEKTFFFYLEKLVRLAVLPYDEGVTWIPRAVRLVSNWSRQDPELTIISTYPPITTHLAALCLKRRKKVRWIADFRDPLLDRSLPGPPRQPWFHWSIRTMEHQIIRHADGVIANTDVVAEIWRRRYPQWAHKIHVIWNGFDPEDVLVPLPIPPRAYRVISHAGTIYCGRHPKALLESLERLIQNGRIDSASLRVRLVGQMDATLCGDALGRLVQRGCVECVPEVPRQEAERLTAESDYLLLLDIVDRDVGMQVPSKLYEYVQVGRPILAITTRQSPVDRILQRSGIVHVCLYPDLSVDEVDEKVQRFLGFPPVSASPGEWFQQQFHAEAQAQTLSRLIEGLW